MSRKQRGNVSELRKFQGANKWWKMAPLVSDEMAERLLAAVDPLLSACRPATHCKANKSA
jgi:hypothetical protein